MQLDEPAVLERTRLAGRASPARVLAAVAGERLPFALSGRWAGGGAIVGADPVATAADPWAALDTLPPVRAGAGVGAGAGAVGGGWFGWLGYRLGASLEPVCCGPRREPSLPDHHLAYYDHVLRLDAAGRWWFEALATPGRRSALAAARARLAEVVGDARPTPGVGDHPLPALHLPQAEAEAHVRAVERCRARIAAGEIFQANICLRLQAAWGGRAADLLSLALARGGSPAYGAAFDTPRGSVASLSPELFLRRRQRTVTTAPIKGTIARSPDPAADRATRARLRGSAKDAAEHVMIVDLMRNDLGRVCEYGTVTAARTPSVEAHPGLWHLVSPVRGRLRAGVGDGALLRATFPPGSVTGAPKVQAMRVIAELEPHGRDVYTGAIGMASPVAGLELSVAIRTFEMAGGRLWLGAGGGIVAESDPRAELGEALLKARSMAGAVGAAVRVDDEAGSARAA